MQTNPCSVETLLENPALSLQLAPGQPIPPEREVVSAQIYAARVDEHRLGAGELVLLVAGWSDAASEPARLAEVLRNADVAAVGIPDTVEPGFGVAVTTALIEAKVPVLVVPRTTRLADIIDVVTRAHVNPDSARFQRMLSMQQALVAALSSERPTDGLAQRLALLVDGTVGIADESGATESTTGVLPWILLRGEVASTAAPAIDIDVAGWHGHAVRLQTSAYQPRRWLFVASRRPQFVDAYVRAAAGVAASLLDATTRISVLAVQQGRAIQRSLLNRILVLQPYESTDLLAERAAALGMRFEREAAVLVLATAASTRKKVEAAELLDTAYEVLERADLRALITERDGHVLVLLEASAADRVTAVEAVLRRAPRAFVGVGRLVTRLDEVPTSLHDANLALQHGLRRRAARLVTYDDLDLTTRLLADVGREQSRQWIDSILGPLRDRPPMMEAVTAYFGAEQDVMRAARELGVHPNTLRYRLTKVEELLGQSIRSPGLVTALHLALTAESASAAFLNKVDRPLTPSVRGAAQVADVVPSSSSTDVPGSASLHSMFGAVSTD